MKLLEIKILRGPNYWSGYWHNLIEVIIDIEELEGKPTNEIPGFCENLKSAMPSLYQHHCSEGHEGGFLERVARGTWIGHVIEHVAIEFQCMAGMDVGYGRTRSSGKPRTYYIAIEYVIPEAGSVAIEAAVAFVDSLIKGEAFHIASAVSALKNLKDKYAPGVTTAAILEEAKRRNIPYRRMNGSSLYMLGYGANQKRIEASIACSTSGIGIDTASNKQLTKSLLHQAYVEVPEGDVVTSVEDLLEAVSGLGFPLVIKPLDANQGKGITTNIRNEDDAIAAFAKAQAFSLDVIVERYIDGADYRLLVVNNKFVAAAKRTPASVVGDAKSTIRELVDAINKDPNRGNGHAEVLTRIEVDEITTEFLARRNLTPDSVPARGELVLLKPTANLSTGGTATDVTDVIHPDIVRVAERISRIVNLDICGIDLIVKDITAPLAGGNGSVLEVNACPGLRMHLEPTNGLKRNVAKPILSMLFPENSTPRIPLVAITGTNGKTTTTRLIAHIVRKAGYHVGFATTDGIYLGEEMICHGDCTGAGSAATVLSDPWVNFAVLECARGGILRNGLGFDKCSTSIVTNIAEDHLGIDGINSVRDMRRVKAVVAESTLDNGYSILNAENDEAYYVGDYLECEIALFAINPQNERVVNHCRNGGLAAVIEENTVVLIDGKWKSKVCHLIEVPIAFKGKAPCMVRNVLAAVLAAVVNKIPMEAIVDGLRTFVPSPELTPGRFNIFDFGDFQLMVDYAHNQAALEELKIFVDEIHASRKVGIITGVGDRRDMDIRELGRVAGSMFDEIIIRHDVDLRGRSSDEMNYLLQEGIREMNPKIPVRIIPAEQAAISYAMEHAWPGSFIVTFTESVYETIAFVREKREERRSEIEVAQV